MQSVQGSNVLITGAAMGLGKLFATNAVKEGAATVILWDANETALKETAAELEAAGGHRPVRGRRCHLAGPGGRAAARVRTDVGTVHVLFNNAGIVRQRLLLGKPPKDFM